MHPSIGQLSNGSFYAYVNGYDSEPLMGSLAEIEEAMGLRAPSEPDLACESPAQTEAKLHTKLFTVTMRFQHPAWNEMGGVPFHDIDASSRSQANDNARRIADLEGLLGWGKGRVTFTAVEQ